MERFFERLDRLLGARQDLAGGPGEGVTYWRRRVLDVAMVVGLALGAISVIPGVIRAAIEQNYVLLVADVAVLIVAGFVLLARGIPYRIRAGLLIAAAFGIGLVQVVTSGLHTPGPLWLFAAPVLAAILFDLRVAMGMVGVVLATLLAQLGLDHAGLLSPVLADQVGSPRWVEVATDLVLLATVVSLFMGVLLQGLKSSFQRVQQVSDDLEAERARLLEANRELEQQIERRRHAEEERAWLATAIEQAEDGVVILETDGAIRYVNRGFQRLFDVDPDEVEGVQLRRAGLLTDPDRAREIAVGLGEAGVWVGRLPARRGDTAWEAQASFSTLRDHTGEPAGWLGMIRDVSRETRLEAQLQQAQKMQAVGTFAGGIAHDFNNLLVPILGTAELLASELEGHAREQLQDIARSARRGKALVAQILAFSRGGERQQTAVQLADVVTDTERLLRASLPADIDLELEVGHPGPANVSDAEVQQVLMNLCTNAFHAMAEGGGTLTVTVDTVNGADAGAGNGRNGLAAAPPDPGQEYVRLAVADTGAGMTEETLSRVFEPFFTTKAVGHGTGLGLTMVHGVTKAAGGTLVIRSAPEVGTSVEVLLPRAAEVGTSTAEKREAPRGDGQTVLVVDDEAPVRLVAARILERLGYRPVQVPPAEARAVLESDRPVDLLITDLSMPEISGLELGRATRRSRPALPMILSTGLVDQETLETARDAGFNRVLAKPYDMAELSRVVAATLRPDPDPARPSD